MRWAGGIDYSVWLERSRLGPRRPRIVSKERLRRVAVLLQLWTMLQHGQSYSAVAVWPRDDEHLVLHGLIPLMTIQNFRPRTSAEPPTPCLASRAHTMSPDAMQSPCPRNGASTILGATTSEQIYRCRGPPPPSFGISMGRVRSSLVRRATCHGWGWLVSWTLLVFSKKNQALHMHQQARLVVCCLLRPCSQAQFVQSGRRGQSVGKQRESRVSAPSERAAVQEK
jgi:hypothetical protein